MVRPEIDILLLGSNNYKNSGVGGGNRMHMCAGTHVSWCGGTDVQAYMDVCCVQMCAGTHVC